MTRRRDDAPRPAPYAVRIGTAERDRASEDLAVHYTEGRLDHEEYAERLDAIWSSRTRDDLLHIFADLPSRPARSAAVPAVASAYRRPSTSGFPWLPAMLVLVALSLMLEAPMVLLVVPWWLLWRRRQGRRTTRHLTAAGHRHLHG